MCEKHKESDLKQIGNWFERLFCHDKYECKYCGKKFTKNHYGIIAEDKEIDREII